jgi:hypothetical protein
MTDIWAQMRPAGAKSTSRRRIPWPVLLVIFFHTLGTHPLRAHDIIDTDRANDLVAAADAAAARVKAAAGSGAEGEARFALGMALAEATAVLNRDLAAHNGRLTVNAELVLKSLAQREMAPAFNEAIGRYRLPRASLAHAVRLAPDAPYAPQARFELVKAGFYESFVIDPFELVGIKFDDLEHQIAEAATLASTLPSRDDAEEAAFIQAVDLARAAHLATDVTAALAFAAFIFRESRAVRPIIAVAFLKDRGFALLNLVSVLVNLAAFSVWLLVPYFLVRVPAYSLTESGAILATAAAGAALAAPIGGRLAGRRISAQQLAIAGAAANGIGLLLLGAWTEETPIILRIAALVVQGVGLGLFQLAYSDIVTAALPLRDRGVAGSLVLLTRTVGTVTAASVVLMVFGILNMEYGFLEGFQKTFQFAALLAFAAAGLSAFLTAQARRSPT